MTATRRYVLAATASLLMTSLAILGHAGTASAGGLRPFKGHAYEVINGFEETNGGHLVTTVGAGQATHLGRFTREVSGFLHTDGFFEGTVTFFAANGDTLVADIEGAFTSPTTLQGTYTFTGGTGRFKDASGVADFEGVTADGVRFDLTFEGTIQY